MQYVPVNTNLEEKYVDEKTVIDIPEQEEKTPPATGLWCIRIFVAVAMLIVWGFSISIPSLEFKSFYYHQCNTYECFSSDFIYLNDTHCVMTYATSDNITEHWNTSSQNITLYFPTICSDREPNDFFFFFSISSWLLPLFGMLFGDFEESDILWRRFCCIFFLITNLFYILNHVYFWAILNCFLQYLWFHFSLNPCKRFSTITSRLNQ